MLKKVTAGELPELLLAHALVAVVLTNKECEVCKIHEPNLAKSVQNQKYDTDPRDITVVKMDLDEALNVPSIGSLIETGFIRSAPTTIGFHYVAKEGRGESRMVVDANNEPKKTNSMAFSVIKNIFSGV